MQRQISLDELLSILVARMDSLAYSDENQKTKLNIITRALYKKGLIEDEDIIESVREEHRILKELGAISELPSEEVVQAIADSILQWIKGDVEQITRAMEEYERKLQEMMQKEQQASKPKIDIASPAILEQLDKLNKGKGGGGSKLIY
jgi:molecular chaperone DnaK (HSP70)